jgi:hypothetical protein
MTVDELARIYVVARSYAYRMASKHQWGRYRHPDGGVRYRIEHVDGTLSKRAGQRRGKVQP